MAIVFSRRGTAASCLMRILILSQVYHPDVVSVAQHVTDLGSALASRGHDVTVVSARNGYDDPRRRFSKAELHRGVRIVRVASTRFGKGAKWKRAADFGSFIASTCVRLITQPRPDVVIALTVPPLISFVGACFARWRACNMAYWVMDLNPDQAIAAGWLRENSLAERILRKMLCFSLRRATKVVVLDRFMRDRVMARGVTEEQVEVIASWSQSNEVRYDPAGRDAFRKMHGFQDRFVVMYSGNHSPCHPLQTVLDAALQLAAVTRFVFCFVGGGSEFARVRQFATDNQLSNIVCLPYQPLDRLSWSLSAADLHLVVMGNPFVGTIHPCKVYNIMTLGIPFAYIGPETSHIADILAKLSASSLCRRVAHGDVKGLVDHIESVAQAGGKADRTELTTLAAQFSYGALMPRMLRCVEECMPLKSR